MPRQRKNDWSARPPGAQLLALAESRWSRGPRSRLAESAGVDVRTVARWVDGSSQPASVGLAARVDDALGLPEGTTWRAFRDGAGFPAPSELPARPLAPILPMQERLSAPTLPDSASSGFGPVLAELLRELSALRQQFDSLARTGADHTRLIDDLSRRITEIEADPDRRRHSAN